MIRAPQITLFLDASGTVHAEAPGLNGTRRKVDFYEIDLPHELYADLLDQRDKERERALAEKERIERERIATHRKIVRWATDKNPTTLQYILSEKEKQAAKAAQSKPKSSKKLTYPHYDLAKEIASIEI
jgi:hypothetical protein